MIKKSSIKKPKAAIYIRVSTEEQAKEGYSLGAQESALKDYVNMMGYDLFKVYRDEGKSAKDLVHRPALQQLLKDAEKKLFKAIFVYKLDRFSRSLKDLILTIEMLKKQEIDFISLQDKIETASASGKLMFHIISSFAEFERDIISERTRFGMAEKAKEGGVITKAPLGYKIHEGKLMIDEDKKKEIQDIFNEYVGTERSLNAIAREHKLSVAGLIKILRNRAYIGEVKFKDNYPGAHESILDKELFTNVQAKLDSNSYERENLRNKNFLTGLDPSMNQDYLSRLALELSKGSIKCERKKLKSEDIKPSDDELSELPGSYKLQKYVATSLLVEEGFDAEDISYDRVFVNADRADIYADSDERKVYVDCTTTNIHKILDYLESEIEYWLILEDGPDSMQCYMFRKIQD